MKWLLQHINCGISNVFGLEWTSETISKHLISKKLSKYLRVAFEELVVFFLVVIDPQRMEVRCYASRPGEKGSAIITRLALDRSP